MAGTTFSVAGGALAAIAMSCGRIETAVPAGARVSDLLGTLRAQYPGLAATQGLIAVNREYVGEQFALHDGDEVALIPPVSGGV